MYHQETKEENRVLTTVLREWCTCDICGEEIKEDIYEVREGRIMLKLGSSYPEGGNAMIIRADVCEGCFMGKLVPWLESQGVVMQKEEVDW